MVRGRHRSAPMSADEEQHLTRRQRLVARRRRYRWTGVLVASVIVGAAGTVAAFAYTDASAPTDAPAVLSGVVRSDDKQDAATSTLPPREEIAIRPLTHADPAAPLGRRRLAVGRARARARRSRGCHRDRRHLHRLQGLERLGAGCAQLAGVRRAGDGRARPRSRRVHDRHERRERRQLAGRERRRRPRLGTGVSRAASRT